MSEEEIFHQALAQTDPDERAAFLEQACGGNVALRASVEAILRADIGATGFMERTAPDVDATLGVPIGERSATVIGPYKLIEQIGEGGMGTVWMAQQAEPVNRLVAVKLIKAGMDSKQVIPGQAPLRRSVCAPAAMYRLRIADQLSKGEMSCCSLPRCESGNAPRPRHAGEHRRPFANR